MIKDIGSLLYQSAKKIDGCLHSTQSLLNWIKEENVNRIVRLSTIALKDCYPWFLDVQTGTIRNDKGSFFSISGIKEYEDGVLFHEQPIIIQDEIGFLGIIFKLINGTLYALMQAKIEPGNVNKVQISPTIQATKSNFTQKHGGSKPPYLDYFLNKKPNQVIFDQIQSEQSSRFLKKRNRNIAIVIEEDIEVLPHFIWMSIGQIKALMAYENLVNMDTRTVLSGLLYEVENKAANPMEKSLMEVDVDSIRAIDSYFANERMISSKKTELVPLVELSSWSILEDCIQSKGKEPFKVVFYDIEIEGREVRRWNQPLFQAEGKALFGLIQKNFKGTIKFLVKGKKEIGCLDILELGPTIQKEATEDVDCSNPIESLFFQHLEGHDGIVFDSVLSEEGGRFFCEENRNVIIEISAELKLPEGYFWASYGTLLRLLERNNMLNIQLRNLLSIVRF